jgi:hypothetical protein
MEIHMVWVLVVISICVVNLLAGRAYSRSLDRREANLMRQFLNGTALTVEQSERIDSQPAPSTPRLQRTGSSGRDARAMLASSRR